MSDVTIRILTQGLTDSSLDSYGVIREDAFAGQRQRYIIMAVGAVCKAYPEADVDYEPGNGMDSVRVSADYDDEREIREDVELILMDVFQEWCDTIPAAAYKID